MVQARAPYALARALAATVLTVTGAASAHTWAGGDVPTAPGLALIAAVVLAASLLVLRRGVPAPVLLPVVATLTQPSSPSPSCNAATTDSSDGWTATQPLP